jgi:hypothetical protein
LGFGGFAGGFGFGGAFDDEFEALVELVFNLFAIFEVFVGVGFEVLLLGVGVFEVGAVFAGPGLGEAGGDPDGTADPVVQVLDCEECKLVLVPGFPNDGCRNYLSSGYWPRSGRLSFRPQSPPHVCPPAGSLPRRLPNA